MNYLRLRVGIRDHIKSGRLVRTEGSVFNWILLEAADQEKPGWVDLNAGIIASCIHETKRKVNDALNYLKRNRYIHYGDVRGKKAPYIIFIDKFPVSFKETVVGKNGYKHTRYITYTTNIFDQDGQFIGDKKFFARLKLRELRSNPTSAHVLSTVLSESLNGLYSDFKSDFLSDFEKMSQVIDKYIENPVVLDAVSDFRSDYSTDFRGDFKIPPHISSNISKEVEELWISQLDSFLFLLPEIYDKDVFNPIQFHRWAIKNDVPVDFLLKIYQKLLDTKHPSPWSLARLMIKEDLHNHSLAKQLEAYYLEKQTEKESFKGKATEGV